MKIYYEEPMFEIVGFEAYDVITASGDYTGINFEDLV